MSNKQIHLSLYTVVSVRENINKYIDVQQKVCVTVKNKVKNINQLWKVQL